jgi:putative ABC transport system permease protein
MIQLPGRLWAVIYTAGRRLWSQRWLSLSSIWGLVILVMLVLSVPLYADAIYYRVLNQQIGIVRDDGPRLGPYAFVMRYGLYWRTQDLWQDIRHADYFIDHQMPGVLGMPRTSLVRYFRSAEFRISPANESPYGEVATPLFNAPLGALSEFSAHVRLTEGRFPTGFETPSFDQFGMQRQGPPATTAPTRQPNRTTDPIEVLVSKPTAEKMGLQMGDQFIGQIGVDATTAISVPLTVVGTWEPRNGAESYWFYKPYEMNNLIITSEAAWVQTLGPELGMHMADVLWYSEFDGSAIRVWHIPALISQIHTVTTWGKMPELNLALQESPLAALEDCEHASQILIRQLYVFSIPLYVLALAFMLLLATLNTNDQRNEVAVLRSRGADTWQILLFALAQSVLLGIIAFLIGVPVAGYVTGLVGQTHSFLQFSGERSLSVQVSAAALPMGIAAICIAGLIMALPMIGAARHTIVDFKRARARDLQPPWWQRVGLDLLLLIPVGYWTFMLERQGSLDILGVESDTVTPFSNPTYFLLPALAIFAIALLFVRLLPLLLRLFGWAAGKLPGTSLVLALRQLARSPRLYATPVLLLINTLGLATFTASVAATLDQHTTQLIRYDVGADIRLLSVGQSMQQNVVDGFVSNDSSATEDSATSASLRWTFLPVQEYQQVQGIQKAARVGDYPMTVHYSVGGTIGGRLMGIDSYGFAQVAFWRDDFASQPLGALMNALASRPEGVLVPETVLQANRLQIGDPLSLKVKLPGAQDEFEINVSIVGTFKRWPTWYPAKTGNGPIFIGNLDNLFEQFGTQIPYDVWLKTHPAADMKAVLAQLREMDHSGWEAQDVNTLLLEEQTSPERQGLFGILSLGFVASVMLTFVGFFLYAVFTYRRRFIELGVLRAIGFSTPQMIGLLASELALLLILGVGIGTALGSWASNLYIPFLQSTLTDEGRAVPFVILYDWPRIYMIYAMLSGLFVLSISVLMLFLKRLRIFQAIKLGETE